MDFRFKHRPFSEKDGDFLRLCQFMIEQGCDYHMRQCFGLERFVDWKFGLFPTQSQIEEFWSRNAHLWFDEDDKPCGFVLSEAGKGDFYIIMSEGFEFAYGQILDWTLDNWLPREGALKTEVYGHDSDIDDLLLSRGAKKDLSSSTFVIEMKDFEPLPIELEEGMEIVSMGSMVDYRSQRILRANVPRKLRKCPSIDDVNRHFEAQTNGHFAPTYHAEFDIYLKLGDGTFVAGCEALLSPWHNEAEIERVCIHSDYQGQGYAKLILGECLNRLKRANVRRAYITGVRADTKGFYEQFGGKELTIYEYTLF